MAKPRNPAKQCFGLQNRPQITDIGARRNVMLGKVGMGSQTAAQLNLT